MIEIHGAGFCFKGSKTSALDNISLSVDAGERVCVLGPNGIGKTVLAELAAGRLTPSSGSVYADGFVGYVPHDPYAGTVSALVYDEIAFGLRCAGLGHKAIKSSASSALDACGIHRLANCATSELSVGQQVLVRLATQLAMDPSYLVLDDTFALLDSATAMKVGQLVDQLVDQGIGVLETTHSIERAMGANRICVLAEGAQVRTCSFEELLASENLLHAADIAGNTTTQILRAVMKEGFRFAPGTTDEDICRYISSNRLGYKLGPLVTPRRDEEAVKASHVLALAEASVRYGETSALSNVSLEIGDELVVVAGPAGSGKSSCAAALAGVLPVDEGEVLLDDVPAQAGNVGFAMQRPADQFVASTVQSDIAFGLRCQGIDKSHLTTSVNRAAETVGIAGLLGEKPTELSAGQQRLAALASVSAHRSAAYVLDNPTAGLDDTGVARVKALVGKMRLEHVPVVVVASDVGAWVDLASRVIFMRGGSIAYVCDGAVASTRTQPYVSCGLEPPLHVSVRSLAGMSVRRRDEHE